MINKVFALSNWTLHEGRFFDTLLSALQAITKEDEHDIGVVEMELQGNEFVPTTWYDREGFIIEDADDSLPTRLEGSD